MLVLPLIYEGQVRGVLELASFEGFNPTHQAFLEQLAESIGIVLNTIDANMLTEDLLKQSQSLAHQLQTRQEELQKTNEELQEKARLLAQQNQEVERKNAGSRAGPAGTRRKGQAAGPHLQVQVRVPGEHVARAANAAQQPADPLRPALQERRRQPDAASRPNSPRRSTRRATTCLTLINDILDLSKIESGTVVVDAVELPLDDLQNFVERTFRHVGETKNVDFVSSIRSAAAQVDLHRCQAAAADHQEPAVQRVQVHASRTGQAERRNRPTKDGAPTTTASTAPRASSRSK